VQTTRLPLSEAAIRAAADVLVAGGLVAFPTETVYGLGARADRAETVRRIFEAKGRPPGNPLIVHVADREAARSLARSWPDVAEALARASWPGPLTLVVERAPGAVADEVTAGGATVAIRVPAHPVALSLLRAARVPIAAPSANRSTSISPTTADHVLKTLDGAIDLVLDAGPTGFGIESTIVDVSSSPMRLLRHGAIALSALASFGEIVDVTSAAIDPSARAAAPGMHAKHYAPRAKAVLVEPREVRSEIEAKRAAGLRAGAIERAPATVTAPNEALPDDAEGYARELYAALHRLDDAGCDVIFIARVPDEPAWSAVRDRLRRATAD
jgi:L-threonylcarbamoyladenylate synthase